MLAFPPRTKDHRCPGQDPGSFLVMGVRERDKGRVKPCGREVEQWKESTDVSEIERENKRKRERSQR